MRNLVIDQGNTKVKYAVFVADEMLMMESVDSFNITDIIKLITNQKLQNVIYSSVAQTINDDDKDRLQKKAHFIELTHELSLPIRNLYETPATLGRDRIAAVVGANHLYPNTACLVVDAGTCIKLDVLNEQSEYLGGNISPGIHMRWKAMNSFTARLPLVEQGEWNKNWGVSTETALQNGGYLGACLEIEGLEKRLRDLWPNLKCILTGGDADWLAKGLKSDFFVHNNLVLVGLNKILNNNVEKRA